MRHRFARRFAALGFALVATTLLVTAATAQTRVTSPKEQFGYNIGDDYFLATYDQFLEYWRKLDTESDRMVVQEIGKTAEGRPQLMAVVTSPANQRQLKRYQELARRLCLADGVSEAEAPAVVVRR